MILSTILFVLVCYLRELINLSSNSFPLEHSFSHIDLKFEICHGGWDIIGLDVGIDDNHRCCSNQSFLMAVFRKRPKEENLLWKAVQQNTMPTYYTLCRLEYEEMNAWVDANDAPSQPGTDEDEWRGDDSS